MVMVTYGGVTKRYTKGLTNRRALLVFGLLLAVVGVAGFFLGTKPGDAYHLDTSQSIFYIVLGLISLFAGEVLCHKITGGIGPIPAQFSGRP